jgi:hypothetical protein
MEYQTRLYLHLVVEFHATSNSVILLFVWKLLNFTTYTYQEFEMFLAWLMLLVKYNKVVPPYPLIHYPWSTTAQKKLENQRNNGS